MVYRIGVFGSAITVTGEVAERAAELGRALAARKCIVITGACSGLPYRAAHEAARNGAEVWGFSPMRDLEGQRAFVPEDDLSIYSRLIYVPPEFPFVDDHHAARKYRNVVSTATCHAGIIIGGRWGTLNEFTNLVDFGKVAGVLTGTGETADALTGLTADIPIDPPAEVIFHGDPDRLAAEVVRLLDTVHGNR